MSALFGNGYVFQHHLFWFQIYSICIIFSFSSIIYIGAPESSDHLNLYRRSQQHKQKEGRGFNCLSSGFLYTCFLYTGSLAFILFICVAASCSLFAFVCFCSHASFFNNFSFIDLINCYNYNIIIPISTPVDATLWIMLCRCKVYLSQNVKYSSTNQHLILKMWPSSSFVHTELLSIFYILKTPLSLQYLTPKECPWSQNNTSVTYVWFSIHSILTGGFHLYLLFDTSLFSDENFSQSRIVEKNVNRATLPIVPI